MFDIGWQEILVIAIVLIVVVGPKDLPRMLRTFGRTTAKMRSMAGDFRRQFDDALKEAELDEVKSLVDTARSLNPAESVKKHLNPIARVGEEIRAGLSESTKPAPAASAAKGGEPAPAAPHTAEPAKTGAAALPEGMTAPAAKPEPAAKAKPAVKPKAAAKADAAVARPAKPKAPAKTASRAKKTEPKT